MLKPSRHRSPLFTRSWVGIDVSPVPTVAVVRIVWWRIRIRCWSWTTVPTTLQRRIAEGTRCAAALPAQTGLVVRLSPPALSLAKRRRVLPSLLDVQLPFPIDQCAVAFVDTPEQTVGLVVRHEDLRASVDTFVAQGANPERITPLGWVLWTQARREYPSTSPDQQRAVLWTSGERLVLVTGTGELFGSITVLAGDQPDALQRALRMSFGGARQELVAVCAGAQASELAERIAVWPSPWSVSPSVVDAPESFLARALAIDALVDHAGDTHVRQAPLAHARRVRETPRATRMATFAVLGSALLLFVVSLAARSIMATSEARASRELSDRLALIAGYPIQVRGARAVQEARDALNERLDTRVERLRNPTASAVLHTLLHAAQAANVQLTHLELTTKSCSLSGRTDAAVSAEVFSAALRATGHPMRLELDPRPTREGRVTFLMTPEEP